MRKDIIKQMSTAWLILITFLLLAVAGKAQEIKTTVQPDSAAIKKLSAETGISKAKAAQVIQVMRYGSEAISRLATDSKINRQEQRRFQIMSIQSQRRQKLDSLLTPAEMTALSRQQAPKLQQQHSTDSLVLLQQRQRIEQGGGQMVKQE